MEPTKRLFVAVRVPLLPQLQQFSKELSRLGTALRIVSPPNWHVTLKFLGNTTLEQEELVVDLLRELATTTPPSRLEVRGTGAFPHLRRPTVIWAGLEPPDLLSDLANRLEAGCETLGFPCESRPWQAHLTLAYVKHRPPQELHTLLERSATAAFGDFAVNELELIESTLTREGPIYTTVASAAFHR